MSKTCVRCRCAKPLDAFSRSSRTRDRDGRQPHCRSCASEYYRSNKERHQERTRQWKQAYMVTLRAAMWEYLRLHPCVDCGEADPVVLEFDHVRGTKRCNVSQMVSSYLSWATILKEIAKCDVRCANCHRRRTAIQFGWYAAVV